MKLLILDLDETLIYATEQKLERECDFQTELYHVYKRPHLDTFLAFCAEHFQVGIWTTAGANFADIVAANILREDYPLQFLWSRKRCTRAYDSELTEHYYVKNLAKLKRKGYKLEHVIMVDDTPRKLERNYGNLVQIKEWFGDPRDQELLRLMNYLMNLKEVEDIRTVEKRLWHINYQP